MLLRLRFQVPQRDPGIYCVISVNHLLFLPLRSDGNTCLSDIPQATMNQAAWPDSLKNSLGDHRLCRAYFVV